jgi:uncharacterized protein YdhG (YjbR/CyaY superfamily)
MKQEYGTPEEYLDLLPSDRRDAMEKLRKAIKDNLPKGFSEVIQYGMISYVVPLSAYPAGYLGDPKVPLPFVSIASQKGHISLYHMGFYARKDLLNWFVEEYSRTGSKIDMGKSCIRFRKMDKIPYPLIGDLVNRMTPSEWIQVYESGRVLARQ